MAGAVSSFDAVVSESNGTSTVLVATIAEDQLAASWPDYTCLYAVGPASFRNRDLRQQAVAELACKFQQSGTAQPMPLSLGNQFIGIDYVTLGKLILLLSQC